jgi:hypothetical protein
MRTVGRRSPAMTTPPSSDPTAEHTIGTDRRASETWNVYLAMSGMTIWKLNPAVPTKNIASRTGPTTGSRRA